MLTIDESCGGKPVHFLGYCVLCLRKLRDDTVSETVGFAPKYKTQSRSKKPSSVSASAAAADEGLPADVFNYAWNHVLEVTKRQPIKFPMTPPICNSCGNVLNKLSTTLKQLERLTISVKATLRDSGRSGVFREQRFFRFVNELKKCSEADDGSRRATLNFLEKMGHGKMTEVDYEEWFGDDEGEDIDAVAKEKVVFTLPEDFIDSLAETSLKEPQFATELSTVPSSPSNDIQVVGIFTKKPQSDSKDSKKLCKRSSAPVDAPLTKRYRSDDQTPSRSGPFQSGNQTCDFCFDKVPRSVMLKHMQNHVGDYALKCKNSRCHSVFSTLFELKRHGKKSSTCEFDSNLHKCEVCGHVAKSLQSLRTHLEAAHETGSKPYACPVSTCTERFTIRQSVQFHIMRHALTYIRCKGVKMAPPDSQVCDYCLETISQDKMLYHLQMDHAICTENIISCKYCTYLFSSRLNLIEHFIVHMTNGTPVSCDLCQEESKYLKSSVLRKHYFDKHQIGTKHRCEHDKCGKEFLTLSSLRSHVKASHSADPVEVKNYKHLKCGQCTDSVYYTEQDLRCHQIKDHGMEPYKCQFCGEEFTMLRLLKRHEDEHKGVIVPKVAQQTAACDQCNKTFGSKKQLNIHIGTVHTTERKFVCEECGEKFKTSGVLKCHKLIHTGERPFKCPHCEQAFRHKEVLKTHIRGHEEKGEAFKPNGPMKGVRKRVNLE